MSKQLKCKKCIFCEIIQNKIPSKNIYEDQDILAILDISQNPRGHILVIPKQHYTDFFHTPKKIIKKVFDAVYIIGKAELLINNVEGINIEINNGSIAGQTIMHFHVHIMPRNIKNLNLKKDIKIKENLNKIINNLKKNLKI